MKTHNKTYLSYEEKGKRLRIFAANMKKVKLLQNNEQGTAIYGATQFADLTSTLPNILTQHFYLIYVFYLAVTCGQIFIS